MAAAAAAPPLYAASVEATSFVGVGTGLALGVAHDAAGEIVLAAVQPPGAAGALPGWRIQEADPQTVAAAAAAAAAELAWIVSVEHPDLRFGPFLLKRPNGNDLLHAQPFKLGCNSDGHGNLRVVGTGRMSTNGGQGKWAQFVLRPAAVAATSGRGAGGEAKGEAGGGKKARGVDSSTIKTVRIMCVGNADKGWCLGVAQPSGGGGAKHRHLIGTATVSAPGTLFDLQAVSTAGVAALPHGWTSSLSSAPQFDDSVDLTEEQRQRFVDDGYLHVKQAVSPELVHDALGAINAALCKPGGNVAVDDGDGSTQYCPGVGGSDAVLNLLKHSAVWTFAQRLLGKGKIMDVQRGQVALRPPNLALLAAGGPQKDDGSLPPKQWHIDGMGKQKHSPFSLLVGITLSDVLQPNCGNFCVFPNSHVKLLPLLRKQVESGSSLFSNENSTDKPAFANGVQLLAEAGDAVFVSDSTSRCFMPVSYHLFVPSSSPSSSSRSSSSSSLDYFMHVYFQYSFLLTAFSFLFFLYHFLWMIPIVYVCCCCCCCC